MAEKSIWHSIVKARWRSATITGDGEWAVVLRCKNITEVCLFDTWAAGASFRDAFCHADFCSKRHNLGSLVPFIPHPPARRQFRNLGLLERD